MFSRTTCLHSRMYVCRRRLDGQQCIHRSVCQEVLSCGHTMIYTRHMCCTGQVKSLRQRSRITTTSQMFISVHMGPMRMWSCEARASILDCLFRTVRAAQRQSNWEGAVQACTHWRSRGPREELGRWACLDRSLEGWTSVLDSLFERSLHGKEHVSMVV